MSVGLSVTEVAVAIFAWLDMIWFCCWLGVVRLGVWMDVCDFCRSVVLCGKLLKCE